VVCASNSVVVIAVVASRTTSIRFIRKLSQVFKPMNSRVAAKSIGRNHPSRAQRMV
jgi:hypothetical protein